MAISDGGGGGGGGEEEEQWEYAVAPEAHHATVLREFESNNKSFASVYESILP
jgi:hypothetical protein